ncbi:MAG: hypothetical protein Q8867_11045, partial [Bacteroidota bacterium]|nr:hypothetical protein [Bacteroidota bacterium]
MKKLFCLILLLLLSRSLFAQIDNTFWFVAPEVSSNHGDRPIFIRVSTMEDSATVTLRMPASPSFSTITQSIPANSTYSFALTSFIDSIEDKPADHVLDRGLQLSSTHLVTAYYEVANESNPEIFPFKGKNALGTEFYISGQTDYRNYPNKGTEAFDIIATEDSTWITITPTLDIVGHEGGVPFRIMLNKGQTYSARTMITTPSASLAGSHVVSNKPIAITISDDSIETGG